jgi:hypothetical protein
VRDSPNYTAMATTANWESCHARNGLSEERQRARKSWVLNCLKLRCVPSGPKATRQVTTGCTLIAQLRSRGGPSLVQGSVSETMRCQTGPPDKPCR